MYLFNKLKIKKINYSETASFLNNNKNKIRVKNGYFCYLYFLSTNIILYLNEWKKQASK